MAGTARCPVLFWGDSTTFGYNGTFPNSLPTQFGTLLASGLGGSYTPVASSFKSFLGGGSEVTLANYRNYDTRINSPGLSAPVATFNPLVAGQNENVLGGTAWTTAQGTGNALNFTPSGSFDRVWPLFIDNPTFSDTVSTCVDGGATLGDTDCNAGAGGQFPKFGTGAPYSVALSGHTVNLFRTGVGPGGARTIGCYCYDSTTPAVDILLAGTPSARTLNLADNTFQTSPRSVIVNVINTWGVRLVIINATINNTLDNTAAATYQTQLQSMITAAKQSGCDVALQIGNPGNTANYLNGNYLSINAVVYALAASNGCAVLDLCKRWTSYAVSQPLGYYSDNTHPSTTGYTNIAQGWADNLLKV